MKKRSRDVSKKKKDLAGQWRASFWRHENVAYDAIDGAPRSMAMASLYADVSLAVTRVTDPAAETIEVEQIREKHAKH